jgi:uncharacterized membrane protein
VTVRAGRPSAPSRLSDADRRPRAFTQRIGVVADVDQARPGQDPAMATNSDVPLTRKSSVPALNPALIEHARRRRQSVENRFADRITDFSGSMQFVYLHAIWFACWIGLGVEAYPYGLLTMIVSLEAIFLSTFVMISQNRGDEKRELLANQEWAMVQSEDRQNEELLRLSRQILELTKAVHAYAAARSDGEAADGVDARPA